MTNNIYGIGGPSGHSSANSEQQKINRFLTLAKNCDSKDQFNLLYKDFKNFVESINKEIHQKCYNPNYLKKQAGKIDFGDEEGHRNFYGLDLDGNGNSPRGITMVAMEDHWLVYVGPVKNYKPDLETNKKAIRLRVGNHQIQSAFVGTPRPSNLYEDVLRYEPRLNDKNIDRFLMHSVSTNFNSNTSIEPTILSITNRNENFSRLSLESTDLSDEAIILQFARQLGLTKP